MDDNGTRIGIKDRNCNSCGDETDNDYMREIDGEGNASLKYLEEKQEETQETCLYDLPRQVWLEIYENIDYPTYLNLRQVSHHFLHLINEYIGIRVTFGKVCAKDPAIFDFFTSVALNDVQFEEASNTEKYNFSRIFKYPSYLTDVSFAGKTNLKLIQDILLNCRNLQLVEMTMDCKMVTEEELEQPDGKKVILPGIDITSWVPPSKPYLKYVECMKLVPGIYSDENLRSHVVLSTLRGTNSGDNLKKVIFQCELSEEISLTNVLNITAELMERHPKLEALFMALLNDEYLLSSEETRKFSHFMDLQNSSSTEEGELSERDLMEYFRNRIEATGQYLRIKKIGLAMLNSNMQLIWGNFLKTQHQLVHLSLTVTIENGTFSQELFDSFSGTLEQLAIRGKFEVPFDFQHISNCMGLKEICLHNLQENGGGGIIPKCINLPQVSVGLESLILFQVVARTEEIMETATKLQKLHTLVLFKCGHAAGETGVGLECLQQILHKRSLQSILMVQFICGSTTEAESLAGVLYDMSQDRENTAGRLRSGRGSSTDQEEFPEDQVEHVLDLPIVEDGGDVLTFPVAEENIHGFGNGSVEEEFLPVDRPVSRGSHRYSDIPLMDDFLHQADDPNSDNFSSPPLSASSEVEEVNDELIEMGANGPREFSLQSEEFPALADSDQPNSAAASASIDDVPEDIANENELEVEEININLILNDGEGNDLNNDENNNNPLDMLQNMLQAFAVNPDQVQRVNHPRLQNHMNLNQGDEVEDEEMEVIIDVGQDIGPMLDLFAAEQLARDHNVQVGFILDGVIDIMNEQVVRSRWLCVEDDQGHITYTLKISVEL